MSVECPQCSESNPDEALYCADCGQLLVPYEPEAPAEEPVQTFATRTSRLGAQVLDAIILAAPFAILALTSPALAPFFLIAILIVQMVLLTRDGQTIGKKALNIRIVVYRTGENGFLVGVLPPYGIVDVLLSSAPTVGAYTTSSRARWS